MMRCIFFLNDVTLFGPPDMELDGVVSENPVPMQLEIDHNSEEVVIDLTNSNTDATVLQVQFPNLFEHFIASAAEEGHRQDMKRRKK